MPLPLPPPLPAAPAPPLAYFMCLFVWFNACFNLVRLVGSTSSVLWFWSALNRATPWKGLPQYCLALCAILQHALRHLQSGIKGAQFPFAGQPRSNKEEIAHFRRGEKTFWGEIAAHKMAANVQKVLIHSAICCKICSLCKGFFAMLEQLGKLSGFAIPSI